MAQEVQRLLLIGKTGNGKSSTGNTILGRNEFKVTRGIISETKQPQAVTSEDGKIKVIDTPDICMEEWNDEDPKKEVDSWLTLTSPGPTAVLLVIRGDVRYTPEEFTIYEKTMELLGQQCQHNLIVVFTMKDNVQTDIEEELKTTNERLKSVLAAAKQRKLIINNNADETEKHSYRTTLFKLLESIITDAKETLCLRVMLLGLTGTGKSATGNSILASDSFKTGSGVYAVTEACCKSAAFVCGRYIEVLDTPGLDNFQHSSFSSTFLNEWLENLAPGPIVLVLVVRGNDRFTYKDYDVYENLEKNMESGDFQAVLVFTGSDQLEETKKTFTTEDAPPLGSLLKGVEGRYVMFDNSITANAETRYQQRKNLVDILIQMAENNKSVKLEKYTPKKKKKQNSLYKSCNVS